MQFLYGNTTWNNQSNASIVLYKDGCFTNFSVLACTRDGVESFVAFITAVLCIVKIIRLYLAKHELWNQYVIFTAAFIEICLLIISWLYLHVAQIDLVAEFLKLSQFLIVCKCYCQIASRISKKENLYKRVFLPALGIALFYFIILIGVGIVEVTKFSYACQKPEWLLLSLSEVVLGTIFLFLGAHMTKNTNNLKTDDVFKRSVKISLWGIILSFLLSSVISMVYDVSMIFLGKDWHCRGLFVGNATAFTATHLFVKLVKWLLPIWAMIITFKNDSLQVADRRKNSFTEDDSQPHIVRVSSEGTFKSTFRPRGRSFNYKHLRDPENDVERQILDAQPPDPAIIHTSKKKKKKKKARRDKGERNPSECSSSTFEEGSSSSISPLLVNTQKKPI